MVRLSALDAERWRADEELSRVMGVAERVEEMERQKRMLTEALWTGLKLGIR